MPDATATASAVPQCRIRGLRVRRQLDHLFQVFSNHLFDF